MLRRSVPVAAAATVIAVIVSCREPTQITVTVTTDAKCSDVDGVSIAIGQLGEGLENKPASAVSTRCDPTTGNLGTVVVVPSGSSSDEVAFRITAGFGKSVDDCKPPFGQGCIVARRAIRYIPHTPLFVPVKLSVLCNGVACDPSRTCENGACVDARVADPTQCESPSGCNLVDGGAPPDSSPLDSSPPDTAPPRDAGPPTALPIVTVGNVPAETGTAQEQHLVYATHSARWWFFYIDDAAPTLLKTTWSTDLVTWTAGATFTLADGTRNEARNFSVTYADIAGNDIVHIVSCHHLTGDASTDHIRATINGASIAFSAEATIVTSAAFFTQTDPSGPVVALSSTGNVFVATGWANQHQFQGFDTTGNMDVYESTTPDDGTSSGPISNYVVHAWVQQFDNNRALVPFGAGEMLAIWPLADGTPDTDDLSWATSKGSWMTNPNLFGGMINSAENDWSACGVSPTSVHVVRRRVNSGTNDAFDHMHFDATAGTWSVGQAIPSDPGLYGSGVVLLTNGTKLLLFAIGSDSATSLRYVEWDGAAWGTWATLFGTPVKRAFLSGTGCGMTNAAALTWTEGVTSPYRAMVAEVTKLF